MKRILAVLLILIAFAYLISLDNTNAQKSDYQYIIKNAKKNGYNRKLAEGQKSAPNVKAIMNDLSVKDADTGKIVTQNLITGIQWRQISGANQATIVSPDKIKTVVTGLIAGTYEFELALTNQFGTGRDTVRVDVLFPPLAIDTSGWINGSRIPKIDRLRITNPITTELIINFESSTNQSVLMKLSTIDGKELLKTKISAYKGKNFITENVSNLPSGIYILSIQNQTMKIANKVVKR